MSRRLPLLVALATATLGLVLTLSLPLGVFSGDEGMKLIQSQALVDDEGKGLELPYPGSEIDSTGRYFPIAPPFAWSSDGERYGIYSFEYTAVGAVFWLLGGLRGVFLLSWLGAAFALWLLARMASRLMAPPWAAAVVAATAIGTPLLLYGTTNFEHAWACALIFSALVLLAEPEPGAGRLAASGALLGLATILRPEAVAFCVGFAGFGFVYWGLRWRALKRLVVVGSAAAMVAAFHLLMSLVLSGRLHPGLEAADHPPTTWELNLAMLVAPEAPTAMLWALVTALAIGLAPDRPGLLRTARRGGMLVVVGLCLFGAYRVVQQLTADVLTPARTLIVRVAELDTVLELAG